MLIFAIKPYHDGAIAVLRDNELVFSLEPEKDSYPRHLGLNANTVLHAAEYAGGLPDIVALGGWDEVHAQIGAAYLGVEGFIEKPSSFFGKHVKFFSSTHERSHIAMAVGMGPRDSSPEKVVLCYEGNIGAFYLVDKRLAVTRKILVMVHPGARWAFLYALADPTFPDTGTPHRLEDSGKLMALAAYGDAEAADERIRDTVDRILEAPFEFRWHPAPKHAFRDSPVYNAGVEAEATKIAARLLMDGIFDAFATAAKAEIPPGLPLYISGGCGLNCDWNAQWRDLGHFSSVFVPPCTDDSGSALGTAIDALTAATGDPHIEWSVYSGLEFQRDCRPDPARWAERPLNQRALVDAITDGAVVAWVQGRWEIGPRALGNRSLLAAPFERSTLDRLNEIKRREPYRPIAPCCRLEDAGKVFDDDSEDPYMLFFRRVTAHNLGAVTHVDGSARVQTVTEQSNKPLHDLLSVFAERHGVGVLCNTSLNFRGLGFINRTSHLERYCEQTRINDFVIGDSWFQRVEDGGPPPPSGPLPSTSA